MPCRGEARVKIGARTRQAISTDIPQMNYGTA
jgi:hypothetical protein